MRDRCPGEEYYILYEDDDAAWEYYLSRYERIKEASALGVPKKALLSEELDVEDLPAFSTENGTRIVAVEDGSPENGIVRKIVSSKTPKHFAALSSVVPKNKGAAQLDRKARGEAVTYVKSNLRTEEGKPDEYLSINIAAGEVLLSGEKLNLEVPEEEVRADVEAWVEYFEGFSLFRGEKEKLARDYFAFWSWLWFGPFLCDLRNAAHARHEDVHDYPIFGILYGKSNCGKSELINTLLISMFAKTGTLPTEWFTRNRVANMMAENSRYPLVFDDLERKRYSDYAVSLIKQDHVRLSEYPPVVLSMNTTTQDAFETEVRKRCFVVYTGAALPDDIPEAREIGKKVRRVKHDLGTALYREYLKRTLAGLQDNTPTDFLYLSSVILREIISEHREGDLPEWCQIASMDAHRRGRHDKVREDLRQLWTFDKDSWQRKGTRTNRQLDQIHMSEAARYTNDS